MDERASLPVTRNFDDDSTTSGVGGVPPDLPERIGRYRIERALGQGGFGIVFLAHDEQLHRPVAVKLPHATRVARPEDAQPYLAEARVVASLDHPNIVPVYDVGSTADHPFFVVSKFIEGTNLATRMRESRLSWRQTAEIVAIVAEALHYAHKKGLVHRDVKPGNILIHNDGQPHVVDFGLALREENIGEGSRFAGTPAYMSPEQARGEGHRVDGRSDVFSLGVVFYETLVGRPPFRGDSTVKMLEQITSQDPRPPRQYDDTIPKELERICLKALSKRASERYTTAHDLADDLRHFLGQLPVASFAQPADPSSDRPAIAETIVGSQIATQSSFGLRIVPKGLRSFDSRDADFFLELLPGPRDRDGLPDSIRFWKTRIEETDPDETFRVGLLYGPSGCGKSSLVKAGLLPRLADHVLPVYLEATSDETERRLLHGLRKRCPSLTDELDLKRMLAALRQGQGIGHGQKVLIVLDQFEQWLHATHAEDDTELVQALRQCDGGRVQCVLMVRDDFWLAVSRFMRQLEILLVEGQNSGLTDLFDGDHAKKVLTAFGRAFGKLPERWTETTQDQRRFLDAAVRGLSEKGAVICVRLALFAEMMKGKPWTAEAFKQVGGTEGIGATFLEETFGATTAPPEHRVHQKAARAVLKALLPESGSDIKGKIQSRRALMAASGYEGHPREFDELIRVLDQEIRLITPADPEGLESDAPRTVLESGEKYYQLTHDYLVHSVREWLTKKQKETRWGRAELRLSERSASWNSNPQNRNLPSLWEFVNIRSLTDPNKWSASERKMMDQAARFHGGRSGLFAMAIVGLVVVGLVINTRIQQRETKNYVSALVQSLFAANTANIEDLVREIDKYPQWTTPPLWYVIRSKETTRKQRLHASLALLRDEPSLAADVSEQLLTARVEEVPVIVSLLAPQKGRVQKRLWDVARSGSSSARLHATAALAAYDSDDQEWRKVAPDSVAALVSVAPVETKQWIELLRPIKTHLIGPLQARYEDRHAERDAERAVAAVALADYLGDRPKTLTDLILLADNSREFLPFLDALRPHRAECLNAFQRIMTQPLLSDAKPENRDRFWKKQANAAVCLSELDDPQDVWPLLRSSDNPSLRSFIVDRLARLGAAFGPLANRLQHESDASIRQALILALGGYDASQLSRDERKNLVDQLSALYLNDPDPGVHSAAAWTLGRYASNQTATHLDTELQNRSAKSGGKSRRWFINSEGQTFVVVDGPVDFLMGDGRKQTQINYRFAMATHEVTVEQFQKFNSGYLRPDTAPEADCPANGISWFGAAAYCNWLSQQEGIPRDQWCYEKNDRGEYGPGMKIPADCLQRTGYRLPTEAEWEWVCRGKTTTGFCFGEPVELLDRYAWYVQNSRTRTWPVGRLRPNILGAFDMHGNAWEWCQDNGPASREKGGSVNETVKQDSMRVLRGGAFSYRPPFLRSAYRNAYKPERRNDTVGFRPARTYP